MKIAVSGKGGVGKSTVAACIARMLADNGEKVLALDADSDANLASAFGVTDEQQEQIVPMVYRTGLIEERTGAKTGVMGQMFTLNPKVDDLMEKFGVDVNGVSLMVLGAANRGGGGCACPENTFLKCIVDDLVLNKNETLIMDMEAGVEHLGRATAQAVDVLIVVVEPGKRSLECADLIEKMSAEIGIKNLLYVCNKVTSADDEDFLNKELEGRKIATMLPFSDNVRTADRDGLCPYDRLDDDEKARYEQILKALKALK